jgi:hypothetical protein
MTVHSIYRLTQEGWDMSSREIQGAGPYDLFAPDGTWFASVPNRSMRDDACADYFEKNGTELTYKRITSAEYSEIVAAARINVEVE